MSQFTFNDGNIPWKRLEGIDHLLFSVLDVDDRNVLHVLFKFSANQRIVLHRHCALNKTFVIQGEHRLYHANGELKDVRPAGSYTVSPPADEPHREGGGDQDVVVLFTIYDREGPLYEILDDDSNIVATLSIEDFVSFYDRCVQHLREPRRHLILRNERRDAWTGTDHREAVAVNQDFRDERPRVVGA